MSNRTYLRRKRPVETSDDPGEVKSWRFLRVMPTSNLQESMQRIPCEFASKFRSKSSVSVSLSGANNSWIVKVSKKKNKLQFCTGWDKFIKDNSVDDGSMILFKYKGDCRFKFCIFDPAGCETLPCHIHDGKQKIDSCSEKRREVYEEDFEEKPLLNPPMSSSKEDVNHAINYEDNTKLEEFLVSLKNPFFFAKNSSRSELVIPKEIIYTFGIQFDEPFSIEDPKKRNWEVRVVTWKDGRVRLTGWNKVRKCNLITDKDACVCELIPTNVPTYGSIKVHIFRNQKKPATF
ncbi:putative B3 domain-containing protein Os03g0621600 isoform X2 [Chenopodium quinoa]|uniref:TF-B3 domain-containing protein n=2 Tax=Chenopodium quinoa TaxID=63459 RepID=A0A803LNX8_CHEQI|nr:putative B3 domain-containing protein Os03g0621600 isoform X2 [Chenopodium quinoa]